MEVEEEEKGEGEEEREEVRGGHRLGGGIGTALNLLTYRRGTTSAIKGRHDTISLSGNVHLN